MVYEYLTANGIGRAPGDPMHDMYCEGLAMRNALAADMARIAGVEVVYAGPAGEDPLRHLAPGFAVDIPDEGGFLHVAHDAPSPGATSTPSRGQCGGSPSQVDTAIIIAPETNGVLLRLTSKFPHVIRPSLEAIGLTSDKLAMFCHWREHGVRTPATTDRAPTACENFPMIWKPRDGCGSTDTFLIRDRFELSQARVTATGPMILQQFVPGRAASIAFLCGPKGNFPLVPAFQHLSTDGRFHYRGGELPIPSDLAGRAVKFGTQALACVPGLKGYIGVDLVLGDAADGSQDYAIEINPRLTTSYVGLRALADVNLADAMLRIARGEAPPVMPWKPGGVRFTPDGTVTPVGQV